MLKLYYHAQSCAIASFIALEEVGAVYDGIRVNMGAGDQRQPDYLAINPKGRVPALVTDQGLLTETPAILGYIAQAYPESVLALPADIFAIAQIQSFNAYLCSTHHVAHSMKNRGSRWANEPACIAEMKHKVPETVTASFDLIQDSLFKGPWVMGDTYSICDPYLYTVEQWMVGDGVDPARFPALIDHKRRMEERPAVQTLLAAQKG
ncbi:glutathione S-transferase family protein [Acidisoma cladoniae]|jgi:glutathione S-transferase|uniref:glutathione S-transferase family protein n=1 Tax=Acidisoma cladoniae TaxID=3040935 RepID=UPI00254BDEC0|nr:glutathione S-transferase family protein [Acidisoma sp. PAMC 29798]